MNLEISHKELAERLKAHEEWLLVEPDGGNFPLSRSEIELTFERGRLLLAFLDEKGFQTWRVAGWEFEKQKILFNLTRNFGRERRKTRLVPRVLAAELADTVEGARLEKANKIADLIVRGQPKTKLRRVRLNQETGRFAQMIFEDFSGKQIAALADVSGVASPENLLASAILWLEKLGRRKDPVERVWLPAEKRPARGLQRLLALLRESRRAKIELFEISRSDGQGELLSAKRKLQTTDLWREKPKKIPAVRLAELSRKAQEIVSLAPREIDAIFTAHGETLRFRGLAFARVRKIFGAEKAWFGVEAKRQILGAETFEEFLELVENLKIYRRADSPNKQHALYLLAPESWLEALLRKNVKRLDANLILSPIYNQFRVSGERIDLLALRRDGRLVVVELKTSPDREMIFQAVDYWRQVELQRRAGNLQKAKIFGDAEISGEPALVYLVAPTLSFHRDFDFLAQTVSPEIEIARFCLNENWRESLKVMRREVIGNR